MCKRGSEQYRSFGWRAFISHVAVRVDGGLCLSISDALFLTKNLNHHRLKIGPGQPLVGFLPFTSMRYRAPFLCQRRRWCEQPFGNADGIGRLLFPFLTVPTYG